MSCNGCRVLRKGCSDSCVLRPCLQWIDAPEAQGHATVFVAKFFGRAGLMSFISAVPQNQRPSLFQSLLYEAAGRTVNPVTGAVGLLWTGNWHACQAAVDTVLRGGALRPIPDLIDGAPATSKLGDSSETDATCTDLLKLHDPITPMIPMIPMSPMSPMIQITHQRSKVQKRRRGVEPPEFDLNRRMPEKRRQGSPSMNSEDSTVTTTCLEGGFGEYYCSDGGREMHLLNLFK